MRRVAVVFTGGTIAMEMDATAGGNVPSLGAGDILARTPGLDAVRRDRAHRPRSHAGEPLRWSDLFEIADTVRGALADQTIDGAVVVQGTDTIEETAFFWDLLLGGPKPLVVTGAMRWRARLTTTGRRTCATPSVPPPIRRFGMPAPSSCWPARSSRRTMRPRRIRPLDTFRSLNTGSLGRVVADGVVVERPRGRRRHVATDRAADGVQLITAHVAMDGRLLDAAAAAGAPGIVVEATGAGNTSRPLLDAARRAMDAGIAVALTTRCPSGSATAGYAFPGGGATWFRAARCLRAPRRAEGTGRARARHRGRARPRGAGGPPGRPGPRLMPAADLLITGRIATLAGETGFGWAESIAVRDGRVVGAGTRHKLEALAGPATRTLALPPDEVALPVSPTAICTWPRPRSPPGGSTSPRHRRSRTGWLGSRRPTRRWTRTHGSRARAGTRTDGAAGQPRTTSRGRCPAGAWRSGRTTTTRCGRRGPRSRWRGSRTTRRTRRAA